MDPVPSESEATAGMIVMEAARQARVVVRMASLHAFERWLRRKPVNRASLALLDPWTFMRAEYRDRLHRWREEQVPTALVACVEDEAAQRGLAESKLPPGDVTVVRSVVDLRHRLTEHLTVLKSLAVQQQPVRPLDASSPPAISGPSAPAEASGAHVPTAQRRVGQTEGEQSQVPKAPSLFSHSLSRSLSPCRQDKTHRRLQQDRRHSAWLQIA